MNIAHPFIMRLSSIITMLVLVFGPAAPFTVIAEELPPAPPVVDVCPNVNGDQPEGTSCADTQCVAPATWNSGSQQCEEPTPPAPTPEEECLAAHKVWENNECKDGVDGNGTDGANATTTPSDGNPAAIVTGNASSSAVSTLEGNTTQVGVGTTTASTTADLDNTIAATSTASTSAQTGENEIGDGDGGVVMTGGADAFSWILSLFNVAVVNSFGSIEFYKNPLGDELDFTDNFLNAFSRERMPRDGTCSLSGCEGVNGAKLTVFDDNVAEVSNQAIARAGTGDNGCNAGDEGACGIQTGDADAFAGIVNIGNLQLIDSRYLLLFMANQGDLTGDILVPDGAFFEQLSTGAKIGAGTNIAATSTAEITDMASSTADSGSNSATGNGVTVVDSGNANATSKDVNFINQLGAPICFIISVGGAWNGDVVQMPGMFSRASAPWGEVICGAGGAERDPVTNTTLQTVNYAKIFNEAVAEAITGRNDAEGLIAAVKTGDARAFAQILNLVNTTIIGQDWIFADFAITGDWNGDLVFGVKPGQPDILGDILKSFYNGGSSSVLNQPEPKISIMKEASIVSASVPATVDYTITVRNGGGHAQDVVVNDTMTGPDGSVIGEQQWDLGIVKRDEEVKITYTIEFKGDVDSGYYTNTAVLSGERMTGKGSAIAGVQAEEVVEILSNGEVLGTGTCAPLLTEYIKPWKANSPEQVEALQQFLNTYEGEELNESGFYSSATQAAVKKFQKKYSSDVLAPWGISQPTANVYYTTQKKVNEIACADMDFSLSDAQKNEINSFKSRYQSAPQTEPAIEGVGGAGGRPMTAIPEGAKIVLRELGVSKSAENILKENPLWGGLMFFFGFLVPFVSAFELEQ